MATIGWNLYCDGKAYALDERQYADVREQLGSVVTAQSGLGLLRFTIDGYEYTLLVGAGIPARLETVPDLGPTNGVAER